MALKLNRPHTRLVIQEPDTATAQMTTAELFAGSQSLGKIMGHPEVLASLALAVDSQSQTTEVAAALAFEANDVRAKGHANDADIIERVSQFVAGSLDHAGPPEIVHRICGYVLDHDEAAPTVCHDANARQCGRCERWFCVRHWSGPDHPCTPAARKQAA